MWAIVFPYIRRNTHVLREIFRARVELANLPMIELNQHVRTFDVHSPFFCRPV